jgi:hypothetical protein
VNRRLDLKSGLVCGLSNLKPTFEDTCKDFIADNSIINEIEYKKVKKNKSQTRTQIGCLVFFLILIGIYILIKMTWSGINFNFRVH